ncbi:hypothetical protein GC247_04055 [Lactobacillus fermentum]|uniref:Uncharacterized protein n=1 Tax=Limosilactobacillus fermentum TaxID=1613 RepID=A0A843QZ20_LIMFE|nr:hypothetical protein [Limosilactobacillus fermentum]
MSLFSNLFHTNKASPKAKNTLSSTMSFLFGSSIAKGLAEHLLNQQISRLVVHYYCIQPLNS